VTRRLRPGPGQDSLTACARVLVRGGADEVAGETLTSAALAVRIGWCAALVQGMAAALTAGHWNAAGVRALASGTDAQGQALPSSAWMALRRLGWTPTPPPGVVVNDRVIRMAQEQAGRTLRSAAWRDSLTAAVLAAWPADPAKRTPQEWDAVRAAIPGGEHVLSPVIRARTRQAAKFAAVRGRLPADLFELEDPPTTAAMLILATCDRQQASIGRHPADPRRALLRLQLPRRPDPRSYKDWGWVAVPLTLPPTVPADAALHLPTLRVTGGRVTADVSFTRPVPAARRDGHLVALGVDWGLNTLLSAGAVRQDPDGTITAIGAGAQYRAGGVLAKAARLRRHSERLQARLGHYERLAGGNPGHLLAGKASRLSEEAARVTARRSNLNDALAWSAARWITDQALAADATVIYLEDLRTLEARGMGKTMNTRLSQTARSAIAGNLRHIAAGHGIAVVTVPPRGTSRCCPRCLAQLRHCKAPDKLSEPGWKWARCPACGWQGDRDTGAWQRIAARGMTHQVRTAAPPGQPMIIRTTDDALEAHAVVAPYTSGRDRSKAGPTPRRTTTRQAPRRRPAPSPRQPRGQRPEGHATTARPQPPRAATRNQGANTTSQPPERRPHRARGAALGAGFHLHAHATPPREPDPGPAPAG
jgi:IS605 OrfB family transposase